MSKKILKKFKTNGWDKKYALALAGFIIGTIILILPVQLEEPIEELPITGKGPLLSVSLSADREHIQRDNPTVDGQTIHYVVDVTNTADCTEYMGNVMFVYDSSGSMTDFLPQAKQFGKSLVSNLDFSKDKVGVVSFDRYMSLDQNLTSSDQQVKAVIDAVTASGLTNIGDAIELAKNELSSSRRSVSANTTIIIFTDGRTNRPERETASRYALQKATEAKNAGIRIMSIVYGDHADTDFLQEVVSDGSDNLFFEPSINDASKVYASLSQNLRNFSFDTKVEVDLSIAQNIAEVGGVIHGNFENGIATWEAGTLQCQESKKYVFTLTIDRRAKDLEKIDIFAQATNNDGDEGKSEDSVITVHAPVFEFTKDDGVTRALPGEKLDYEITIENVGTGNAYHTKLVDFLPEEYFVINPRSISYDGDYDSSVDTITWDDTGSGFTLDGSFSPTKSKYGNSITLEYSGACEPDLDFGIYTVENVVRLETASGYIELTSDLTDIAYGADLSISKSSTPTNFASWGGEIAYKISVANNGTVVAENVQVYDDYDEIYFTVSENTEGTDSNGQILWQIDSLEVGQSKTFTYAVDVSQTGGQTMVIKNNAWVSCDVFDLAEDDNRASSDITISDNPFLEFLLDTDQAIYPIDQDILVTFVISNNSNFDAADLSLLAQIPSEFDYVAGSTLVNGIKAKNPSVNRTLNFNLGDLKLGEDVRLTFKLRSNDTCRAASYTISSALNWKNKDGNSFGPLTEDVTITVEQQQKSYGEVVLDPSDLKEFTINPPILSVLPPIEIEEEGFVYLKVLTGLLIASPLPLLLIFDKKFSK